MLSPSLARLAKLGARPAGVKRRFKINAASPTTSNASGSLMSGGLHASEGYPRLTHFCGFGGASVAKAPGTEGAHARIAASRSNLRETQPSVRACFAHRK